MYLGSMRQDLCPNQMHEHEKAKDFGGCRPSRLPSRSTTDDILIHEKLLLVNFPFGRQVFFVWVMLQGLAEDMGGGGLVGSPTKTLGRAV